MSSPEVAGSGRPAARPIARIGMSTASAYPEPTTRAFELAARLDYDAVEVMVGIDPLSQDVDALRHLVDYHQIPVCSVHAPCLLITQRVWGSDPWVKLVRSTEMAATLGAETVVVHPPFRWQREYARGFVEGVARLEQDSGVAIAVENMYPWRASKRQLQAYVPSWDPVEQDYAHVTLDLSHTATSHSDALAMARKLGRRLRHVHLADGTGSAKDEHLVPGEGTQPCAELLAMLADPASEHGVQDIVVEINTRKVAERTDREADLAASLAFARFHFTATSPLPRGGTSP